MRRLRSVPSTATPEEVAAIVAAIGALEPRPSPTPTGPEPLPRWVHLARLSARRAGYQRGEWRLSGRIGRRSRA